MRPFAIPIRHDPALTVCPLLEHAFYDVSVAGMYLSLRFSRMDPSFAEPQANGFDIQLLFQAM